VEGAFQGRGRYYHLVPGDNVELAESPEKMLRARGCADIIVPVFVEVRNKSLQRQVISKLYTKLINLASGYHLAYYNGNPMYLRAHVVRFHVEYTGFGYQAEFLTRLISQSGSFKEIPLVARSTKFEFVINLTTAKALGTIPIVFTTGGEPDPPRRLRFSLFWRMERG
jgi:hypothetical protein